MTGHDDDDDDDDDDGGSDPNVRFSRAEASTASKGIPMPIPASMGPITSSPPGPPKVEDEASEDVTVEVEAEAFLVGFMRV